MRLCSGSKEGNPKSYSSGKKKKVQGFYHLFYRKTSQNFDKDAL